MKGYVLRVEAVNLVNFVYDCKDLSTVRGGGLLLLRSVREVQSELTRLGVRPEAVSTGASSGVFQFEAEGDPAAAAIRGHLEKFLGSHPKLRHATFVVDVQPRSVDFARDRESLLARNRWRQMRAPAVIYPDTSAEPSYRERVCKIDEVRPAVEFESAHKGHVSLSVSVRRSYGLQQKQKFYEQETGRKWPAFVHDFERLAEDPARGNLDGKMALIYLDGNRFGELQNRYCHSADDQKRFDEHLKQLRRGVLTKLLEQAQADDSWRRPSSGQIRLETLLWGGDDITWVVPAWLGWRTLELFFRESRDREFRNKAGEGARLTHAGGLVFCNHKAPIHSLVRLARDLAELAKDEYRRRGADGNLFCYQVLESFDHIGRALDPEFLRSRYPFLADSTVAGARNPLVVPGQQMEVASMHLPTVKEGFPRRKLHDVVQALMCGKTDEAGRVAEATLRGLDAPVRQALEDLAPSFGGKTVFWLHVAELWDYVP